jgi:hypothetical protein
MSQAATQVRQRLRRKKLAMEQRRKLQEITVIEAQIAH